MFCQKCGKHTEARCLQRKPFTIIGPVQFEHVTRLRSSCVTGRNPYVHVCKHPHVDGDGWSNQLLAEKLV